MATTNSTTTNTTATTATDATALTDASLGIQTVSLVQDTSTTNLVTAALLPELVYAANAAPASLPNTGTVATNDTTTTPVNVITDLPVDTTAVIAIDPILFTDPGTAIDTTTAADVVVTAVPVDAVLFSDIPVVDLTVTTDPLATINTVTPTLTNNGEPLVVIDETSQNVLTTDAPVITDTTVLVDTPVVTDTTVLVDTPVVTDTTVLVDPPVVTDTTVLVDPPVVTDTTVLVDTPVVTDTTVLVDPLVNTPVDTPPVLPVPEEIVQSADQVLEAVITSIVGSTQGTQPTLSGTSEPGTVVSIIDNGTTIGQAVAGDDWQWTFTPTALTSGEVHTFSVDAARADGSGGTQGGVQTVVGIGVESAAVAAPVITSIVTISNGTQALVSDGGQTDDLRPVLQGTSEPDTVVEVFDHGVKVGQAVANADWQWEFQPAQDLTSNTAHSFTVTASHVDGSGTTPSVYAATVNVGSVAAVIDTPTDTVTNLPVILDDSTTGSLDQLLANAGLTSSTDDTTNTTTATTTTTADTDTSSSTTVHTCPHVHATHAHATHAAHDFAY